MFIVETIEVLTPQSTSLSFKFQSRDRHTITDQGYKKIWPRHSAFSGKSYVCE